jgi:hypothetical protein
MPDPPGAEGLLITGAYGTGKSAAAAEIADVPEKRGDPYAAIDLDWLAWLDSPMSVTGGAMLLANLRPVVDNYLSVGVRFSSWRASFGTGPNSRISDRRIPFPLNVVHLTVPLSEIERRLRADPTAGRKRRPSSNRRLARGRGGGGSRGLREGERRSDTAGGR